MHASTMYVCVNVSARCRGRFDWTHCAFFFFSSLLWIYIYFESQVHAKWRRPNCVSHGTLGKTRLAFVFRWNFFNFFFSVTQNIGTNSEKLSDASLRYRTSKMQVSMFVCVVFVFFLHDFHYCYIDHAERVLLIWQSSDRHRAELVRNMNALRIVMCTQAECTHVYRTHILIHSCV